MQQQNFMVVGMVDSHTNNVGKMVDSHTNNVGWSEISKCGLEPTKKWCNFQLHQFDITVTLKKGQSQKEKKKKMYLMGKTCQLLS